MNCKVNKVDVGNKIIFRKKIESCKPTLTLDIGGGALLHAYEANTFFSRLRGLHVHLPISDNEALVISRCNSIHTIGMPSAIDSIFVDSEGLVLAVKTVPVRRWASCPGATTVIEINEGICARLGIFPGVYIGRDTGDWTW